MTAPDRLRVLRAILDSGAVPIFTAPDPDTAFDMVAGCADGGATAVEFTEPRRLCATTPSPPSRAASPRSCPT